MFSNRSSIEHNKFSKLLSNWSKNDFFFFLASNIYIVKTRRYIHISRNIVTRSSDETDRTMLTKRWNKILAKRLHVWFPVTPETGTPAIVIRSNDDPRSKERRSVHVVAIYLSRLIITSNQCLLPSPHPHPERVWSRTIGCFSGGKGSTLRVDDHRQRGNWLMKASKYACPNPNCRSVFAWKRNLTSHLRYQCGQQPRFKCPYCEYKCKVKTDIRKHIKTKHKNRDVYVIDVFQSWQLLQWERARICNERIFEEKTRGDTLSEIEFERPRILSFPFPSIRGKCPVKLSAVEEEGLVLVDVSHASLFFSFLLCLLALGYLCWLLRKQRTNNESKFSNYVSFFFFLLFEIRERQFVFGYSKNMLETRRKLMFVQAEESDFFPFEKDD